MKYNKCSCDNYRIVNRIDSYGANDNATRDYVLECKKCGDGYSITYENYVVHEYEIAFSTK